MTRCTLSKWKWQLFPILDNLACMRQSPNYGISFSFQFPMCATVQTILLPHNINVSPREESKIQSVHLLPTAVLSSQQGELKGQEGEAPNTATGIQETPSSCTSYCTVSKLTEMFYFYVPQKHLYIPRYHFKTAIYFSCTHPCRIVILMAQQSKVTQETEVGAVEVSSLSRPWVPGTMGYIIKHCIKKYTFKNYPNLAISYKLLPW